MMKPDLRVALRRNRRQLIGKDFEEKFGPIVRSIGESLVFVDDAIAITTEELLYKHLEAGLKDGTVSRQNELSWDTVARLLNISCSNRSTQAFLVYCHHWRECTFYLSLSGLINVAERLVQTDRDTIYATTENASQGIGIDQYDSELTGKRQYALDIWGFEPARG